MRRRRREHPLIPSPLIGQGFPPHQAARAVIQVVREIHEANYDLDPREIEEALLDAVRKARRERSQGGGA